MCHIFTDSEITKMSPPASNCRFHLIIQKLIKIMAFIDFKISYEGSEISKIPSFRLQNW